MVLLYTLSSGVGTLPNLENLGFGGCEGASLLDPRLKICYKTPLTYRITVKITRSNCVIMVLLMNISY